jgi:hypothetical protein
MNSGITDYLEELANYASVVRVPGLDVASAPIPIADIFVEIQIHEEGRASNGCVKKRNTDLEESVSGLKPKTLPEPALGAFARERRMVILGEPGQGKTTLLRQYAASLAANWANGPLPLLVELGRVRAATPEASRDFAWLYARLPEPLKQALGDVGWQVISGALRAGNATVLLDGFDELGADAQHQVGELAATLRAGQVVLSSRPHIYRLQPLPNFKEYKLGEPSSQQVEQLATSVCRVLGSQFGTDGELALRKVLSVAHSPAGAIARNPLLLSFMCLTAVKRMVEGKLEAFPARPAPLIGECVDALVEWHRTYKLNSRWPKELLATSVMRILAPLALASFRDRSGIVSQKTIDELDPPERRAFLSHFLDARFVERRDRGYVFPLETLREYFAALALAASPDPYAEVKQYLHRPEWKQVIVYTAANLQYARAATLDLVSPRIISTLVRWSGTLARVGGALLGKSLGQTDPIQVEGEAVKTVLEQISPLLQGRLEVWLAKSRRSAEFFISSIWKHHCRWRWRSYEQILGRDLRLAGYCLGGVAVCPEKLARELVSSLSKRARERDEFVAALGEAARNAAARARLLELVRGPETEDFSLAARVRALATVAVEPEVQQRLLAILRATYWIDSSDWRRQAATEALVTTAAVPEIRRSLVELMRDKGTPGLAAAAASVLARATSEPGVRQSLLDLTRDNELQVRAVAALSKVAAEPEVRRRLLDLACGENLATRTAATLALGACAPESEVQRLMRDTLNQDSSTRGQAAEALGALASRPDVRRRLLQLTYDNQYVACPAARSLATFASEAQVKRRLLELTNRKENESVREAAAKALASAVYDSEVQERLLELAGDDFEHVHAAAVRALAPVVSAPDVQRRLLELTRDNTWGVRQEAVLALAPVVSAPDVRQRMVELMRDKRMWVRRWAAQALKGWAGPVPDLLLMRVGRLARKYPGSVAPTLEAFVQRCEEREHEGHGRAASATGH